MSWEVMSSNQKKCPCGLGTYTIKLFMDDWNRPDEHWEMDCPICKQKHQLYDYYYYDSGMRCTESLWVTKEAYEEVKNIETQLNRAKQELIDVATSLYIDRWLTYFQEAKTKKEVWRRLTDNGNKYPSLSTFYTHLKNGNIEEYLRKEFNYDNVPFILHKLGVVDIAINEKLQATRGIEGNLHEAKEQLMREGFH